jgi:hypothetical protein
MGVFISQSSSIPASLALFLVIVPPEFTVVILLD